MVSNSLPYHPHGRRAPHGRGNPSPSKSGLLVHLQGRVLGLGLGHVPTNAGSLTVNRLSRRKLLCEPTVGLATDQGRRLAYFKRELARALSRSYTHCGYSNRGLSHRLNGNLGIRRFGFLQMLSVDIARRAQVRRGTITRVRNRCVLTGHGHTVSGYALGRAAFRRAAGYGKLPGLKKV